LLACSSDDSDGSATGGAGGTTGQPDGGGGTSHGGSGGTTTIDRSGLTDVGTDAPLDYSDANLWVCRPGNDPNECTQNLDVTVFEPDGTTRVEPHVVADDPAFDCFYVYPTVDLTSTGNTTDFSDISLVLDPLMAQGAPFSSMCEVYAPLYRQMAIGSGPDGGLGLNGDTDLAYGDVQDAFDYYLQHDNQGRKFVLMGHSQGTMMLTRLVAERVDTDPTLRDQMISALLIGGGPTVPTGEAVGGSFQNVPMCTTPGETGCFVAYNSYAAEAPPGDGALFGAATDPNEEVACSTPGPLGNGSTRSRAAYLPKVVNQPLFVPDVPAGEMPAFDTPFAKFPDLFDADCVHAAGRHYLEITRNPPAGDTRPVAPYRTSAPEALGFGLHIADYSMVLDDVLEIVRLQADAALN
jgi:hypothetical protein